MTLSRNRHLLDINILIALADETHIHHPIVMHWIDTPELDWGVCAFTEAGFLRIATNPIFGSHTVEEANEVLMDLAQWPGYRYWAVSTDWTTLTASFRDRIVGHQQITDAFLLGLAVQEDGVLVTVDKAILYMAGKPLSHHVLVLE
jgi:toxin-antitoxin system PIN domain toxin